MPNGATGLLVETPPWTTDMERSGSSTQRDETLPASRGSAANFKNRLAS